MSDELTDVLTLELAPPMANGEVVFEAPWQGRAFGMARALAESGACSWDEFRAQLIRAIGEWDRSAAAAAGAEYEYWDHFLAALEALLEEKGLVPGPARADRVSELAARPHGHDH
jgi:nitrile hydratase accessory protein